MSVLTMATTEAGPAASIGSGGMKPLLAKVERLEGSQQAQIDVAADRAVAQEAQRAVISVQRS